MTPWSSRDSTGSLLPKCRATSECFWHISNLSSRRSAGFCARQGCGAGLLTCKGVTPCPRLLPSAAPHPTANSLSMSAVRYLRLLGPTKLKEYESKEKLASRSATPFEPSATSALVPAFFFSRGPRISATVMSHFDWLSLLSSFAARFATGFMSSAVNSSCAQADQPSS